MVFLWFSYDFPIKPPFSIWYPQLEKLVPKHPSIINPQHEVGLQKDMHRRDAPANQSLACGDGSKPYPPVVHIKIAGIYGCSSP